MDCAVEKLQDVKALPRDRMEWHHRTLRFEHVGAGDAVDKISVDVGKVIDEVVEECLVSRVADVLVKIRSTVVWAHRERCSGETPVLSRFLQLNDQNDLAWNLSSDCPRVKFTQRKELGHRVLSRDNSALLLVEIEKPLEMDVTVAVDILWHAVLDDFMDWLPWRRRPNRQICDVDLKDHLYKLRSRYGRCTDLEFAEALGGHSKRLWEEALDLKGATFHRPESYSTILGQEEVERLQVAKYIREQYLNHREKIFPASVPITSEDVYVENPGGKVTATRHAKLSEIRTHFRELYESGLIGEDLRKFYCDYPLSDKAISVITASWWSDVLSSDESRYLYDKCDSDDESEGTDDNPEDGHSRSEVFDYHNKELKTRRYVRVKDRREKTRLVGDEDQGGAAAQTGDLDSDRRRCSDMKAILNEKMQALRAAMNECSLVANQLDDALGSLDEKRGDKLASISSPRELECPFCEKVYGDEDFLDAHMPSCNYYPSEQKDRGWDP